ncbi:hypothetical protein Mapa_012226 [Marchantia paleacea]|nr:hypothetical protein Mapa_012226 [Marchantia paleacea]
MSSHIELYSLTGSLGMKVGGYASDRPHNRYNEGRPLQSRGDSSRSQIPDKWGSGRSSSDIYTGLSTRILRLRSLSLLSLCLRNIRKVGRYLSVKFILHRTWPQSRALSPGEFLGFSRFPIVLAGKHRCLSKPATVNGIELCAWDH